MDLYRRYIPTDFEMELFPSVIITDEEIPSIILLVFAGFLVVKQCNNLYKFCIFLYQDVDFFQKN